MKDIRLSTAAMLAGICLQAQDTDHAIHFKRGATQARVRGHLSNSEQVCYGLVAKSGQTMKLYADAKNGSITINVTSPDGNTQGEPGGSLTLDLKQTGRYRACVSESKMGDPWIGPFNLKVVIK